MNSLHMQEDCCKDLVWLKADIPKEKSKQTVLKDVGTFSKKIGNKRQVLVCFEKDEVIFQLSDEMPFRNLLQLKACDKNQDYHLYSYFIINVDGVIHLFIPDDTLKRTGGLFPENRGRKLEYSSLLESTQVAQETKYDRSEESCCLLPDVSFITHSQADAIVCSSISMFKDCSIDVSMSFGKVENRKLTSLDKTATVVYKAAGSTEVFSDADVWFSPTNSLQDDHKSILLTKNVSDVIEVMSFTVRGQDARLTKAIQDMKTLRLRKLGKYKIIYMVLTKIRQDVLMAGEIAQVQFMAIWQTLAGRDVLKASRLIEAPQAHFVTMWLTKFLVIKLQYMASINMNVPLRILHAANSDLQWKDTGPDADMFETKSETEANFAGKRVKEKIFSKFKQNRKLVIKEESTGKGKYAKEGDTSKQENIHFKTVKLKRRFSKEREKQKARSRRMFKIRNIVTTELKETNGGNKWRKPLLGWSWNSNENLKIKYLKEENISVDPCEERDITALKDVIISLHPGGSFHSDNFVYPVSRESDNSGDTAEHSHTASEGESPNAVNQSMQDTSSGESEPQQTVVQEQLQAERSDSNTLQHLDEVVQETASQENLQPDRRGTDEMPMQESDAGILQPGIPVPQTTGHICSGSADEYFVVSSSPSQSNTSTATSRTSQQARYPRYIDYRQRVGSFSDHSCPQWPSKDSLALSGFFYAGVRDFVRCFRCGGGLHSWEADDDPYIEHARWFPHCSYIRELKGQEYIDMVQQAAADVQVEVAEEVSQRDAQNASSCRERRQSSVENAHAVRGPEEQRRDASPSSELIEENRKLKEMVKCLKCNKEKNIVFLPCGHLVLCQECAENVHSCPVCRKQIKKKVKTSSS